ncbi:hypothetical protein [Kitasatospora sp. NBC_00458]|uniref:hypothetical protein n=1 Tax=Kitasatospora sp. NBC_00458 TaxID=2903568 RepID=UPI002E18BA3D
MFTKLWWSEWWHWLVLWSVAAGSLLFLAGHVGREALRSRRLTGPAVTDGICLYLDERGITDQYQTGRHSAALTQEVERRTSKTTGAAVQVPGSGVEAHGATAEELVTRYVETHQPIEVIGVLVKVLEKDNGIVHANLKTGTVRNNAALARLLGGTGQYDPHTAVVLLSDAEDYVLLKGRFRTAHRTSTAPGGTTVFLASYGPATAATTAAAPAAHVRVVCDNAGLRTHDPSTEFSGSCLGKVKSWNGEDGVLEVRAVAIFH